MVVRYLKYNHGIHGYVNIILSVVGWHILNLIFCGKNIIIKIICMYVYIYNVPYICIY